MKCFNSYKDLEKINLRKKYFEFFFFFSSCQKYRTWQPSQNSNCRSLQKAKQRDNRNAESLLQIPVHVLSITDFMNIFAGYPSQRQFSRGVVYSDTCGGEFLVSVAPFGSVLVVLPSKTKTPNQRSLHRSRQKS